MAKHRLQNPAIFICDIQEKFRPAIDEYPSVIRTAQRLLKAGAILSLPVHATTQNSARLGPLCSELSVSSSVQVHDKTAFSMCVTALISSLPPASSVAIVGIEAHICVTQTTLDLLKLGHKVYVLADGVSSCNKEEVPIALRRLAREGAIVTTSESWLYEVMGDAGITEFKRIAGLVKEEKEGTRTSLENLCKI